MRPRRGAYNMRPVHEGKHLAYSGRARPAQRVFGSPCPRPDSEARAPAKNHHFAAWTPPASLSIQARRGGPLEPTGTGSRASARSPRAHRNTAWRRAAMRGEPGGAAKDARGWRAPAQGRARAGGSCRVASGVEEGIRRSIDPRCAHRSASPGSRDAASPQGPQADAGATGAPTAAAAACVMRRAGLQRSQPRVRRATRAGGSVGGGSRGACEARVLGDGGSRLLCSGVAALSSPATTSETMRQLGRHLWRRSRT